MQVVSKSASHTGHEVLNIARKLHSESWTNGKKPRLEIPVLYRSLIVKCVCGPLEDSEETPH